MSLRLPAPAALLLAAVMALSACESAEERAERFYRSGVELLEAGDVDRALVEFRNVFDLNPLHREARLTYARVTRERGKAGEAYGQYLRVVEQYPDETEAHVALAEMAVEGAAWDEAARHAAAAGALAPDDPRVALVQASLSYRAAAEAQDAEAAAAALAVARAALGAEAANLIARRIVLDHALRSGDTAVAREEVEAALAAHPDLIEFHMLRLQLATAAGDDAAVRDTLETMVAKFPDNIEAQGLLIAWHLSRGELDEAEAFLRRLAAAPGAGTEEKLAVVEFLRRTAGGPAAAAELEALIAAEPAVARYRALRAALAFDAGEADAAVAAMVALVDEAPASDEARDHGVMLARMLAAQGDAEGARARVDAVLADDPGHVEALKLRARWLIDADRPGDAVAALRTALAEAPRDAETLTMMGEAHEREGARQLAGERYSLAVEVSGRAPRESLRYAAFLGDDARTDAAIAVIAEALAVAPTNLDLLAALADLQLRKGDWNAATRVVWQLRALGTEDAAATADAIEVETLLRQRRIDDTLALLDSTLGSADPGTAARARAQMIELQLRAGRTAEARALLDATLAAAPDDPALRYLRAALHALEGEAAEAEALYRALVAENPAWDRPLAALAGMLAADGRGDEAMAAIETAVAAAPDAPAPQLLKAGALEAAGDIEGAIAVYEALYARDSGNLLVANNLASLLAAHRPDADSLDRAFTIARRLAGSDIPAFQDTYGWIEYRRGNHTEALKRLEPAAAGLPGDPLVQFHLGMTYHALGRSADARAALVRALELAGDSPLPQFAEARRVLDEIGGG